MLQGKFTETKELYNSEIHIRSHFILQVFLWISMQHKKKTNSKISPRKTCYEKYIAREFQIMLMELTFRDFKYQFSSKLPVEVLLSMFLLAFIICRRELQILSSGFVPVHGTYFLLGKIENCNSYSSNFVSESGPCIHEGFRKNFSGFNDSCLQYSLRNHGKVVN